MTISADTGFADLSALMAELTGDEKHSGAAESTLDVLWVLYDWVLAVSPETIDDPHRDRFLLGLALAGMRPVVHTFASFLAERAYEQIKLDLTHQGVGAVLVSAGASYDMAQAGRTHQAPADVALIDTLPGWTVHVPGHPDEAHRLLLDSLPGDAGAYLRLSEASPTWRARPPIRSTRPSRTCRIGSARSGCASRSYAGTAGWLSTTRRTVRTNPVSRRQCGSSSAEYVTQVGQLRYVRTRKGR